MARSDPAFLTTLQTAELAGVTPQHIRNLAKQGRIPVDVQIRRGRRRYLFPADEVELWLKARPARRAATHADARLAQLEAELLSARLELERERAGRQMAEHAIYQLQGEVERRNRAIAALVSDVSDPSELIRSRRRDERG